MGLGEGGGEAFAGAVGPGSWGSASISRFGLRMFAYSATQKLPPKLGVLGSRLTPLSISVTNRSSEPLSTNDSRPRMPSSETYPMRLAMSARSPATRPVASAAIKAGGGFELTVSREGRLRAGPSEVQ